MKKGFSASVALDSLLKNDSSREVRQVAFVDSKGNVASFTGKNCIQYASHIKGSNRVDDSETPLPDLRRLYNLSVAYGHMNNGDLATEKGDMKLAKNEYNAAMKMFPGNLEMQYWTAITLANNGNLQEALPMLKTIFAEDTNWKELTRRLPPVGLLTVSDADLKRILSL